MEVRLADLKHKQTLKIRVRVVFRDAEDDAYARPTGRTPTPQMFVDLASPVLQPCSPVAIRFSRAAEAAVHDIAEPNWQMGLA